MIEKVNERKDITLGAGESGRNKEKRQIDEESDQEKQRERDRETENKPSLYLLCVHMFVSECLCLFVCVSIAAKLCFINLMSKSKSSGIKVENEKYMKIRQTYAWSEKVKEKYVTWSTFSSQNIFFLSSPVLLSSTPNPFPPLSDYLYLHRNPSPPPTPPPTPIYGGSCFH